MINYKINDRNKYLPAEGGTLSGDLNMGGRLIKNVANPVDDSDIVNYSTLNTKLASTDPYKVGDILYTARTDLGDKWALCNGSTAPVDSLVGKMLPMNIANGSYKDLTSYNPVIYYNGVFYMTEFDPGSDAYGYPYQHFLKLKALNFGGTSINAIYSNSYNTCILRATEFYHSNDGYINILYYTQYEQNYAYYVLRYNIATKKASISTNSDGKNFWSYKFNGYYYTVVPNVGIYRGNSFNARTTLIKSIGSFRFTSYNFYHDKKNNDLYLPLYQKKSNIIRINSSNQLIEITPSNGYSYTDRKEVLTSVVRDEDDNIIISQFFDSYSPILARDHSIGDIQSSSCYVCSYNRTNNSCTTLSNCPGFIPLLSDEMIKINGKYITINQQGVSEDSNYYIKCTLKIGDSLTGTYTSSDFASQGGPRYAPNYYPTANIFYHSNGLVINFGEKFTYSQNNSGDINLVCTSGKYQWVNLPTISSNSSYAYIKIKE